MKQDKPRLIKDFNKIDDLLLSKIHTAYPEGFAEYLISYYDKEGVRQVALPFETSDRYYLLRINGSQKQEVPDDHMEGHNEEKTNEYDRHSGEEKYHDIPDSASEEED